VSSGLAISPAPTTDPAKPIENASVQTRVDTGGRTQVRVTVNPETALDPSDPVKPEAPKPDAAPVKSEEKPADAPKPTERPSWLPAKFADADAMKAATIALATKQGAPGYVIKGLEASESGAEVAAAYADFEKKIDPNAGKPVEKDAPKVEDKPKEETPVEPAAPVVKTEADKAYERENFGEYVATMLDTVGVRAVDLGAEFEANGRKLTPETYAKFEKAGVTKTFLNSYIAGMVGNANELAEAHVKEVKTEVFGGEDGFNTVAVWAQANMTKEQAEIYNTMTHSGSLVAAKEAARMLKGWHEKAVGTPPKVRVVPDVPTVPENRGYESREQMMADMSDPRYKMGDKAFHRLVDEKLKHTKL
jgi:hypothetical protein